jgi:hypothetical protein
MLKEIIKVEREKVQSWNEQLISKHVNHREKMSILKIKLEELGEGCISFKEKFFEPTKENLSKSYLPTLSVANFMGCVDISNCQFDDNDNIEWIAVCGLELFSLMGEKHSVESFFKKIARYLR